MAGVEVLSEEGTDLAVEAVAAMSTLLHGVKETILRDLCLLLK